MIEQIAWAAIHFACWALMLVASAGAGHLLLRKVGFHSSAERLIFTLALGLGMWALTLFLLGLAGGLYAGLIFWVTIAAAVAAIVQLVRAQRLRWRGFLSLTGQHIRNPRWPVVLLSIPVLAYWLGLLVLALYPPLQWDATSNHLVLASKYLAEHRLFPVLGVAQPLAPALNHMLFAWGLAVRDDILSQLMELTLLLVTAGGLYAWGKREGSPLLGLAAACVWLGHPIVILLGRSAYTDVGVSCFVFLGLYALRVFWIERTAGWWYLSASLLAMAAGAKLSGLFFAIAGCGFGLLAIARDLRESSSRTDAAGNGSPNDAKPRATWKVILGGLTLALCIAVPWYAYIARETGNPVWPSPALISWRTPASSEYQANYGTFRFTAAPRTLGAFLRLPFDWRYHPELFQSEVPLPLLSLILVWPFAWIVAIWSRRVRWWAAWALAFTIFWFTGPQQLRYWLPAVALAGLAICESVNWLVERPRIPVVVRSAIWVALILFALVRGGRRISDELRLKGMPPTNPIARETLLTKFYGGYSGVTYINQHTQPGDVVCVIGGSWLNYYFQPEVIDLVSPMYGAHRPTFRPGRDEEWMRWLELKKVTWIFVEHAEPQGLGVPREGTIQDSFWADYQLVYADSAVWVFQRKSTL